MCMRCRSPLLNIKYRKRWVCNGLPIEKTSIWTDCSFNLLAGAVRREESAFYAETLERDRNQVIASAVDRRAGDDVVTCRDDVDEREKHSSHSGACEHRGRTSLKIADFPGHGVIGRIANPCIEIPVCFQIEELRHLVTG